MRISVKLFGLLRRYRHDLPRGGALSLNVATGTTVGETMRMLRIPSEAPVVAMVNSMVRGLDHILTEGDQLYLFPPVSGG
jgi:molybdopterin converting factor small subunit